MTGVAQQTAPLVRRIDCLNSVDIPVLEITFSYGVICSNGMMFGLKVESRGAGLCHRWPGERVLAFRRENSLESVAQSSEAQFPTPLTGASRLRQLHDDEGLSLVLVQRKARRPEQNGAHRMADWIDDQSWSQQSLST